jgi:hypothetical protein
MFAALPFRAGATAEQNVLRPVISVNYSEATSWPFFLCGRSGGIYLLEKLIKERLMSFIHY